MHRFAAEIASLVAEYRACRLCPRDCGVDRLAGPSGAFCRLGEDAFVYKELLSFGEEPAISPTWLIDLGGCSLRCLFCTEWHAVVHPAAARAIRLDPEWFRARLALRRAAGARTVSFVGGDPTPSLLAVVRALAAVPQAELLPVVWNANGLASPLALQVLTTFVTTWVIDSKFGNPECASRLAGAEGFDAPAQVARTLEHASATQGPRTRETGDLPRLVVRHLLMPGHLQCCTVPVLDALAARWPEAWVNVMTLYLPAGPAANGIAAAPELSRMADASQIASALRHARAVTRRLWVDGRPVA